ALRRLRGGGRLGAGLRARQPRRDDRPGARGDAPAPAVVRGDRRGGQLPPQLRRARVPLRRARLADAQGRGRELPVLRPRRGTPHESPRRPEKVFRCRLGAADGRSRVSKGQGRARRDPRRLQGHRRGDGQPGRPRRAAAHSQAGAVREGIARLTLVLGAVMATGPLALDMYLPALPTLEAEFAASTARVQHTVSAYLFGMGLGQLAFGPLTDRFGRKRPLLAGLGLFALASAGCALAHSIDSFVLLRFAQALGGSAGMVVIRAVIRDRFDALQSARVLSLMMLVMGVAPILAPLAGGWLLVSGSWHWIFFVLAAYALFCVAVVFLFLEESHPPDARAPSVGRALAGILPLTRDRRFLGPTLVFIAAFGAFFAYLAAAPFVFIRFFSVPADRFGWYSAR